MHHGGHIRGVHCILWRACQRSEFTVVIMISTVLSTISAAEKPALGTTFAQHKDTSLRERLAVPGANHTHKEERTIYLASPFPNPQETFSDVEMPALGAYLAEPVQGQWKGHALNPRAFSSVSEGRMLSWAAHIPCASARPVPPPDLRCRHTNSPADSADWGTGTPTTPPLPAAAAHSH